jgi:hypothetical protein
MLTTQLRQPEKARTQITRRIPQPTIAYDKHEGKIGATEKKGKLKSFPNNPRIP